MKFQDRFKQVSLLVFALVIMSFALNYAYAHKASTVEYTYKVHNKSRSTITAS